MQRYFIKQQNEGIIYLEKDDIFHIKKVMRGKNGDEVICINMDGVVHRCRIDDIDNGKVSVLSSIDQFCELDVDITLIYAMPKGDKFELVLQKATELGVKNIVPLLTRRCVVKLDQQKFAKKKERYTKILKEASEQSYRNFIPLLHDVQSIATIEPYLSKYNLVAYEEDAKTTSKNTLYKTIKNLQKKDTISIIVGSEGGFDESEIQELEKLGVSRCTLGKRILRSETAPLYMLSVIGFALEEM